LGIKNYENMKKLQIFLFVLQFLLFLFAIYKVNTTKESIEVLVFSLGGIMNIIGVWFCIYSLK